MSNLPPEEMTARSRSANEPYLRGRVAQVFDGGNQGRPRWTITDAHAVRDLLDELRKLKGKR